MSDKQTSLQESVSHQREVLITMLADPMKRAAKSCVKVWGDREKLNHALTEILHTMSYCKYLYVLDKDAVQISDNVSHEGLVKRHFGRGRSERPYMQEMMLGGEFMLSTAYMSLREKRPSLTAMQLVRDEDKNIIGYIGADFDLRDLPLTRDLYEEPREWTQIKGDPSIRGNVFAQTRSDSDMDRHIDTVFGVIEELIIEHGVFHAKFHFSSNRSVIWHFDDPFRYRLLSLDVLVDPNICLAYPTREYPKDAVIPKSQIRPILDSLRHLRFMDDTLYLRSGALNIFNGIISLNFSCDGSHYMPYDEFLNKEHAFWSSGEKC
ncbi:MAG: PDC sensor domain-containing protein [Gammaproteobacteria bacterium]|nr:PDC sensor domain-containing protein [Gammaproteobacteria bacterium]MDH5661229.1 PDC sensor domain-containing protein [Gammaproteobacteria bacterium]